MKDLWSVLGATCLSSTFYGDIRPYAHYDPCADPRRPTRHDLQMMQAYIQSNCGATLSRMEVFTLVYVLVSVEKAHETTFRDLQFAWKANGFSEPALPAERDFLAAIGLMCVDHPYRDATKECADAFQGNTKDMQDHLNGNNDTFLPKFCVDDESARKMALFLKTPRVATLLQYVDDSWIQPGRCDPAHSLSPSKETEEAKPDYWPWWAQYIVMGKVTYLKDLVQKYCESRKGRDPKQCGKEFLDFIERIFSWDFQCLEGGLDDKLRTQLGEALFLLMNREERKKIWAAILSALPSNNPEESDLAEC
jgi:hypothetical protein